MPQDMIREYIEIIDHTQSENANLSQKVSFLQRELQASKSELINLQLTSD